MRSLLVAVFFPVLFLLIGITACQNRTSNITIIENVRGYTFYDGELDEFASIAFQNGKVVEVAVNGPLEADSQNATVIDGDNRVMLPGLIDAHGHVMELGFNENRCGVLRGRPP
ncbi:MAG: hypothetical protein U5K69_02355 [Balneolaceae bacterium]|nr:hypothetical protein [Balneolaceae bacterium]